MRLVMLLAVCLLLPATALAGNAPGNLGHAGYHEQLPGIHAASIIVYTDDCVMGNDYVVTALTDMGLAYTLYSSDYAGFEAALAGGTWDIVLVNHDCYYELSYAWDDVVNAYMGGSKIAVATFDWDGSNDYSGYVDDLLALGEHTWAQDIIDQPPVYVWNADPVFTGLPTMLTSPFSGSYIDEGDVWSWTTAEAGITPDPEVRMADCNIRGCDLIFFGFVVDELGAADGVAIWKNVLTYFLTGPSAVDHVTWGAVKTLVR